MLAAARWGRPEVVRHVRQGREDHAVLPRLAEDLDARGEFVGAPLSCFLSFAAWYTDPAIPCISELMMIQGFGESRRNRRIPNPSDRVVHEATLELRVVWKTKPSLKS